MVASLVQLAGAAAITTGAAMINPAAGWITGGVIALLAGVAATRPSSGGDR